jgi:hypothetical protein
MAEACRGSFRGHSGRASRKMSRQFLTHSVTSRPPIDAVRKVYSITSSAMENTLDGTSMPVLGANDGILSTASLIVGVAGVTADIGRSAQHDEVDPTKTLFYLLL